MDVQLVLTAIAIAIAGAFVLRQAYRTVRSAWSGNSCAGGCGCSKTPSRRATSDALIAPEQIRLRSNRAPKE